MKTLSLLFSLLLAPTVAAQSNPAYERILLPLVSRDVPGVGDSVWTTEIWAMHEDPSVVIIGRNTDPPCPECIPLPMPPPADGILYRFGAYTTSAGETPGQYVYVLRDRAERAHFSLRVRDTSHNASSAGVEVPAARENDFSSRPLHFLNVPQEPGRYRSTLRIYSADPDQLASAEVLLWAPFDNRAPRITLTVALTAVQKLITRNNATFALRPPVAEIALPIVPTNDKRFRIEVRPIGSTTRLWGFVSVTDNETQQVTIIPPQ
ncbi:MAG: hypothetical protein M3Q69_01455 [Acidobacteriota bacterium]|nr:hypothetical protein [Acidobacteriota bacterium]